MEMQHPHFHLLGDKPGSRTGTEVTAGAEGPFIPGTGTALAA